MTLNDNEIIQKILSGNRQAERLLYDNYRQFWFRLCLRYGRNKTEAEDILQEGLLYIFRDLKQFNADRGQFKSWSARVLVNAALRYLKKNQWQQSFADLEVITSEATINNDILERISAKELTQVIQKLPSGYRVVFNMYAIEGFSHREIAEHLNISISTSKSQLFKARRALKQHLEVLFA
jgi:RNA polymerase sigma-70 factor (ECF subfamily)